ncbi:MAG: pyridoxine 5'-phosphate synthase [SAR86 cluster bacterium]|jgi:pyridoxine 5-phosphate synthase|nr:pyridoxine 5'-phosphate synthase [SAR86 cluster bacterium]
MTKLSVNVNKIAWLRNARGGNVPDLSNVSKLILESGSHGITVHPRPDLRHILPKDVYELSELTKIFSKEFNIEGNPFSSKTKIYDGFMEIVRITQPIQCTLVPDSHDQLTSDHGWNLLTMNQRLEDCIMEIKELGTRVSLFIDPDIEQVIQAKEIGADRIELYTGPYAEEYALKSKDLNILEVYKNASEYANSIGLEVNAGHDLNLQNLSTFLSIGGIAEVSIGQALISDSLVHGIPNIIKEYLKLCA